MLIAARNSFMVGRWKNPYITDGLVAMWDGEWNAGGGIHDPNGWVDLSGNGFNLVSMGTPNFGDNYALFESLANCWTSPASDTFVDVFNSGTFAIEMVAQNTQNVTGSKFLLFGGGWAGQFKAPRITGWSAYGVWNSMSVSFNGSSFNPQQVSPPLAQFAIYADGDYWRGVFRNESVLITSDDKALVYPLMESPMIYKGFSVGYRYNSSGDSPMTSGERIYCIRLYSRALTANEKAANYAVDKARFNLP